MVRVTKLTDYGIALMTCLAKGRFGQQFTAQELSRAMKLPLPTVRKILKILAKADLLKSTRGATGGYSLARDPREISLLQMIAVLEGPVAMTECSAGDGCHCSLEKICGLKENWNWINKQLESTLNGYNLAQMAGSLADDSPLTIDR